MVKSKRITIYEYCFQDEVTSPGGSTAAALRALELGGLRGTMMSAVSAAADRCRDMNK